MGRFGLFGAPVVAVGAVGATLLLLGRSRPVVAARVYGGPSEGATHLSFRIETVERQNSAESPRANQPVEIAIQPASGARLAMLATTDSEGFAYLEVPSANGPVQGPILLSVHSYGQLLGQGQIRLTPGQWRANSQQWGHWIRQEKLTWDGFPEGLTLSVAPARGLLAVPFRDSLWVVVEGRQGPLPGVVLSFEPEGMTVLSAPLPTDARGFTRVPIETRSTSAALRITADAQGEGRGTWYSTLPVISGALNARRVGGALEIASPIVRSRAYFALITETERLAGGAVSLQEDGTGGSVQRVVLPQDLPEEVFAVVSSEPDLNSPGAVGWPLFEPNPEHLLKSPPRAFSVPEIKWIDGVPPLEKAEQDRDRQLRHWATAVVGTALAVVLLSVLRQVRRASLRLRAHLVESEAELECRKEALEKKDWLGAALGLACIILGFVLLAMFLEAKRG